MTDKQRENLLRLLPQIEADPQALVANNSHWDQSPDLKPCLDFARTEAARQAEEKAAHYAEWCHRYCLDGGQNTTLFLYNFTRLTIGEIRENQEGFVHQLLEWSSQLVELRNRVSFLESRSTLLDQLVEERAGMEVLDK